MNRWACHSLWFGAGLGLLFLVSSALAQESRAGAETGSEVEALKKALEETRQEFETMKAFYEGKIQELEGRLKKLEEAPPAPARVEEALPAPPPTPPVPTGMPRVVQTLLPDISVIGDFVGNVTDDDNDPLGDRFTFREVELALQAALDPYARADFFIAVEREPGGFRVDLEEGYVTALTLPFGLQAKAGRFLANFGRLNRIHRPEMFHVDHPLVLTNFFGEEARLRVEGVSVSGLIPNPWEQYLELSLEVFNGDNEVILAGSDFRHPAYLGHLKFFSDLTEASSLEVGASGLVGYNDPDATRLTTMQGIDLTYKWKPPLKALYRSFMLRTEFLFNQREQPGGEVESFGFYTFGRYQLSRRWFAGLRYDYSQFPTSSRDHEWALSPILEFWPSEFSRLRAQYRHTGSNFGRSVDEFFLQWTFTIGAHRPEIF